MLPKTRNAVPGLAILLSSLLCGASVSAQTPAPAAPAQTTPPVETPAEQPTPAVRTPGNADWASTVGEARRRAIQQNKFVFIEFDAKECGNCQRMDQLLYPAFDFEALLIPMVPVKVSLETSEGRELAAQHAITDTPAILIESPEGRLVFLMQGFTSAPDFYAHAHQDIDAYKAFARKVDAQDISKLSGREAFETAQELYQRGDSAGALPRLKRAILAPGGTTVLREDARELLAAVELDGGDIAASRRTIGRLIATTKDSKRRERAELFRAQIPLAENKPQEAYALFLKFEKDHPKSQYLPQVRDLISRMKSGENPKP
jgi:thioredoxin-related protein